MTNEWTKSFTVYIMTVRNALKRWSMVLMSVVLLRRSCSVISWLYEVSISLRSLLYFFSICLRNSSWLKDDLIVYSSFDRDTVVSVAWDVRSLAGFSVVFVFYLVWGILFHLRHRKRYLHFVWRHALVGDDIVANEDQILFVMRRRVKRGWYWYYSD